MIPLCEFGDIPGLCKAGAFIYVEIAYKIAEMFVYFV